MQKTLQISMLGGFSLAYSDGAVIDYQSNRSNKLWMVLAYLLTHRGQILSREHLLQNVWDSNGFVLERTVDVHITHLRKKLGQYGKRIVTKSGYGYMFSV